MKLNKHETKMLDFIKKYKLHSIAKDALTQRTAKKLQSKGLMSINKFNQIKI